MSPISDQELQRHLTRRTSRAITPADREDVLAAVTGARARPRFALRRRPGLLLAPVAVAVLIVLVGVPLLWTLAPGPGPSHSPSPWASPSTASLAPSPSPPSTSVTIYSAQQLSDMIGDPAWVGRFVLARTRMKPMPSGPTQCPAPPEPCSYAFLPDAHGPNGVVADTSQPPPPLPPDGALLAFQVGENWVEYFGPAKTAADGSPLSPADIPASAAATASDEAYVVSGWLVRSEVISCPLLPPSSGGDADYFCVSESITATPTAITEHPLFYAGGLLIQGSSVQGSAYDTFALNPTQIEFRPNEYVSSSDRAVYLVRPAGGRGSGPDGWWMLGRLDPPMAYVHDDLLVGFCNATDQAAISSFESKYGLSPYRDVSGNNWVTWFKIADGVDAFVKQPIVAADPSVCSVQLHWIGTAAWPSWAVPTASPL